MSQDKPYPSVMSEQWTGPGSERRFASHRRRGKRPRHVHLITPPSASDIGTSERRFRRQSQHNPTHHPPVVFLRPENRHNPNIQNIWGFLYYQTFRYIQPLAAPAHLHIEKIWGSEATRKSGRLRNCFLSTYIGNRQGRGL